MDFNADDIANMKKIEFDTSANSIPAANDLIKKAVALNFLPETEDEQTAGFIDPPEGGKIVVHFVEEPDNATVEKIRTALA